jgi:hypothetical protein
MASIAVLRDVAYSMGSGSPVPPISIGDQIRGWLAGRTEASCELAVDRSSWLPCTWALREAASYWGRAADPVSG